MATWNLSQTAPLVAVPSLPPSHSLVSAALQRVQTLLPHVKQRQERSERPDQPLPFLATPVDFSWKSTYTPLQDWNGYW